MTATPSPEATPAPDPTMEAVIAAVSAGRDGDVDTARRDLLRLWARIGVTGDPFHRCTVAHYLADLYDDPAESLMWDVRALDAADALTDRRARRHHGSLRVAGFYPSLYLNLADDLRRLGAFRIAAEYIAEAERHVSALSADAYGDTIRTAVRDVGRAVAARDSAPRAAPSAPTE
ncbi:hypothetical protein BJF85_14875 [Saccharomonospora sp. CUA-673]|uniref:hypothetical protein n=1 Tax=Saccharomonospora sp. CUA-673 TaxID=1904969 RepID=UPI0009598D44|nr:hypothetical protein [Saccharomonospora sp. CUA-673]OLT47683.1 hypothetical protein BJF85_14875 [Saccharomonospora sp. CUA-673]